MTRVWLDDVRLKPEGFDVHVRTAQEAIELLGQGEVTLISLDHDLGPENSGCGTGYEVASWIEEQAFYGFLPPLEWRIHSANSVGRRNMEKALQKADEFWNREERR